MNLYSRLFGVKNAIELTKDKQPEGYISEQQKFRQQEDLLTLENAISEAENITNPQRYELNRIFDEIELDPHFTSQWETRKMKTIQREFGLYRGDSEEKDPATELLHSDWFNKIMSLALDYQKRGHIVLSFGKWNGNSFTWSRGKDGKLYEPIRFLNFDHVIANKGVLKKNNYDNEGLDLFKAPLSHKTLFLGSPTDLGILRKCAKYILFKNNCLSNWSEFAEVFGHDLRIGKTDSQGADRKGFFDMLKKLGSGGFGIMSPDDQIEFAGTGRTDAYQVYKELNEYVDKNISMLIFGQDVLGSMTGVTRGTAAENVADLYGDADAKFLAGVINNEIIPKLSAMGVPIEGLRFKWDTAQGMTMSEQIDVDFKLSQMGKVLDSDYLADKYGATFQEETGEPGAMASSELPQIFEYHIENGIVNKNEVRERLGFEPDNTIDKEETDAELARQIGLMKESRAAGIPLEEAARLAGFAEADIKKMVKSAETMAPIPKTASPEQVANKLKELYGNIQ